LLEKKDIQESIYFKRFSRFSSEITLPYKGDISICFALSGKGSYTEKSVQHSISANQILVAKKPEEITLTNKIEFSFILISFSKEHLRKLEDILSRTFPGFSMLFNMRIHSPASQRRIRNMILSPQQAAALNVSIKRIESAFNEKNSEHTQVLFQRLTNLIIETLKFTEENLSSLPLPPQSNMDKVFNYIHQNYKEPIEVSDLAKMANLSYSYFMNAFKNNIGTSPANYILKLRIDEACRLLKDPNQTVTQVANQTGFKDNNYFARLFKQMMKTTPSNYRKSFVSQKKTGTIAIVTRIYWNIFIGDYYIRMLAGLFDSQIPTHYDRQLLQFTGELTLEKLSFLTSRLDIKGIIIIENSRELKNIAPIKIPVIHIGDKSPVKTIPSIWLDNYKAGYEIGSYLVQLGHEKIAIIQGRPESIHNADRLKGFMHALNKSGIRIPDYYNQTGYFFENEGYECGLKLLSLPDPPTAVFCFNDRMALGLMKAAFEKKVRIPENLSIIGFDDIELASRIAPALTTYNNDPFQIGSLAMEAMVKQLETQKKPQNIITHGSLIIRQTTSAPPKKSL
jgi:DNA-binding LacI/PurR family transcriptional regulator